MTAYTSPELATRVLRDLGLLAAEETPSAADLSWAEETCQSEILMMAEKGIVIWNGSEVLIPQEYLTTLSRRLGLAVAPSFGLVNIAEATQAMNALEADLRRISAKGQTGVPQKAVYY